LAERISGNGHTSYVAANSIASIRTSPLLRLQRWARTVRHQKQAHVSLVSKRPSPPRSKQSSKLISQRYPFFVSPSGVDNDNNDPACQNSPMTTNQLGIARNQNRVVIATATPSLLPAHLQAETKPLQYRPSTAGNPDPS
jgi:hypothetical protein